MKNELTKDFTQWMNEGFCGKWSQDAEYGYQMTKALELADGTILSIQAGRTHYCKPRVDSSNGDYNDYDTFEVGFPNDIIEEILQYAEDIENPTETVYANVPKQLLRDVINKRGGVIGYIE